MKGNSENFEEFLKFSRLFTIYNTECKCVSVTFDDRSPGNNGSFEPSIIKQNKLGLSCVMSSSEGLFVVKAQNAYCCLLADLYKLRVRAQKIHLSLRFLTLFQSYYLCIIMNNVNADKICRLSNNVLTANYIKQIAVHNIRTRTIC